MNAFTAHDLQAAELLAPALPGDDGPRRPRPARLAPDMIAHEHADARPPPAVPPVTASRAEMIAASSGRARQQRTPALTGVG